MVIFFFLNFSPRNTGLILWMPESYMARHSLIDHVVWLFRYMIYYIPGTFPSSIILQLKLSCFFLPHVKVQTWDPWRIWTLNSRVQPWAFTSSGMRGMREGKPSLVFLISHSSLNHVHRYILKRALSIQSLQVQRLRQWLLEPLPCMLHTLPPVALPIVFCGNPRSSAQHGWESACQ